MFSVTSTKDIPFGRTCKSCVDLVSFLKIWKLLLFFAKVSYLHFKIWYNKKKPEENEHLEHFLKGLFLSQSYHRSNYFSLVMFQCCVFVLSLIYASGKLALGCIIKRLWTQIDRSILSHRRILNHSFPWDWSLEDGFWRAILWDSLQHFSLLLFSQNPTPA